MLTMVCVFVTVWFRKSDGNDTPSEQPIWITGDKRFAEQQWVVTVNGGEYGLIQWSGNDYQRRSTLVMLDQIRFELPCPAIYVLVAVSAMMCLLVWMLGGSIVRILKQNRKGVRKARKGV